MSDEAHIEVANIPEGHVIVGYIAQFKVLDEDGELYWAIRRPDVNTMEAYGMACDLADTIRGDLQAAHHSQ